MDVADWWQICCSCKELAPIDLTNLVWSAHTVTKDMEDGNLLFEVKRRLSGSLKEWRPKEIASLAYTLGALNCHPGVAALDNMLEHFERHSDSLSLQYNVNALCGVSMLNHMPSRKAIVRLEKKVAEHLDVVRPPVVHHFCPFRKLTPAITGLSGLLDGDETHRIAGWNPKSAALLCMVPVRWPVALARFSASPAWRADSWCSIFMRSSHYFRCMAGSLAHVAQAACGI